MNDSLIKHFLSMKTIKDNIKFTEELLAATPSNIVSVLNRNGVMWAYEFLEEVFVYHRHESNVSVALYLPGHVLIGTGIIKREESQQYRKIGILRAMVDAVSFLSEGVNCDITDTIEVPVSEPTPKVEPPKTETPKEEPKAPVPSPEPTKPKASRYTQQQIDSINAFKNDYSIETDAQFLNYLKAWNPEITDKRQLTPQNIDNFLAWVATLGV